MGHITHDQRAFKRPVTRPPRAHACCFMVHDMGEGWTLERREAEGDCNLIPASPWHKDGAVLVLASVTPSAALPPPAGSDNNSQLSVTLTFLRITSHKTDWAHKFAVANGLHVPPIAYKLRSLSDLPSLIIQVARTPTHGVLVSVLAVVYTRILVSDRIGACPFSSYNLPSLFTYELTLTKKFFFHLFHYSLFLSVGLTSWDLQLITEFLYSLLLFVYSNWSNVTRGHIIHIFIFFDMNKEKNTSGQ